MRTTVEAHVLDASECIEAEELCRACRITIEELHELAAYGAPSPLRQGEAFLFTADWVMPLREAARMRHVYDLDLFAVSLIAQQLRRIEVLQSQLRSLGSPSFRR